MTDWREHPWCLGRLSPKRLQQTDMEDVVELGAGGELQSIRDVAHLVQHLERPKKLGPQLALAFDICEASGRCKR
jgi:hypothetical protein